MDVIQIERANVKLTFGTTTHLAAVTKFRSVLQTQDNKFELSSIFAIRLYQKQNHC